MEYKWKSPFAIVAPIVLITFLGWPYLTAYRIKGAVRVGDAEALAALVDFPALRQGLKEQLIAVTRQQISEEVSNG